VLDALEAGDPDEITDAQGFMFRRFADKTKSDRRALAACLRGGTGALTPEQVGQIKSPTLIAIGTRDNVAGPPEDLAALIPGAQVLAIPDRDHMLAVGDRVYKAGVLKFLEARP
jgi:pimeloyl-ACP methyl ester carboxylesterase